MHKNTRGTSEIEEFSLDPKTIKQAKTYIKRHKLSYDSAGKLFRPELLKAIYAEKNSVPIEIFCQDLGAFEAIVKYLRENCHLQFSEIARITHRSVKTVWTAYQKARSKNPKPFFAKSAKKKAVEIPLEILKNRKLGVQENIVVFLKDNIGLTYHGIADALKRDDRTIWTAYSRAKKKLAEQKTNSK
ncbi:hypothetical protein ACFL96_17310 [Thermoproteota archaeon]